MDEESGKKIIPVQHIVPLFIRDYLYCNGPSTAWEIYRALKEVKREARKKVPSYRSFWKNYIWPLKKLGLIVPVGRRKGANEYAWDPVVYDLDRSRVTDPAWYSPLKALYGEAPDEEPPEPFCPAEE